MEYFSLRGRTCMTFSFPPFGLSDMPPENWGLNDYSAMTFTLLDKYGLGNVILIGHSFGGRVAIDMASGDSRSRIDALAATMLPLPPISATAFLRDRRRGADVTKYYSPDWLALPERMRGVFSRIVSLDLTARLGDIVCPTALIWGVRDKETPMYMCGVMKRRIRGAEVIRMKGGHFAYAEDHLTFVTALADLVERWTRHST